MLLKILLANERFISLELFTGEKIRQDIEIKFTKANTIFVEKCGKKSVTLQNIKKNRFLSYLSLIKQNRLSVMHIDSKSWKILYKMGNI